MFDEVTFTTTSLSPLTSPVSPETAAVAPGSVGIATTVTEVVPAATTMMSPSSTSLPSIVKVSSVVVIPLALAADTLRPCIGTRINNVAISAVSIFLTVIVFVSLFVSTLLIMLSPSLCKFGLIHRQLSL